MDYEDREIQKALQNLDPIKMLWQLAKRRANKGIAQDTQINTFTRAMEHARQRKDEPAEDAITHVLDSITGWCPKHSRIYGIGALEQSR